jgi:prolyl oligopeptidase
MLYNFWQDSKHVQGIWRRTTVEEYKKKEPRWDVLLDLDALGAQEKVTWVWHGADCLEPEHVRCMLTLSPGGKDASVSREFDLSKRAFVDGGFSIPEAKHNAAWLDRDTLLVATDFGPGSTTRSGYPRLVKTWKRGTPLASATLLFEGKVDDVSADPVTMFRPEGGVAGVVEAPSFFESILFVLDSSGTLKRVPFPRDAKIDGLFDRRLLAALRTPWVTAAATFPAGALVALPLDALSRPKPEDAVELLFAPDDRSSLSGVTTARSAIYLDVLENVEGDILRMTHGPDGWKTQKVPFPAHGNAQLTGADDFEDLIVANYDAFLTPPSAYLWDPAVSITPVKVKSLPERFDAADLAVEQSTAVSRDGTLIPYFLVHKKNLKLDGDNPTLLYGYGGFEVSMSPGYSGGIGKVWLEKGGVYALANIRGGGEFGPRWHQAALTVHRQIAYDDFIAVAESLIARKVTSPKRLGIMGGSNGGLLVGATFVERPELFSAVVCQVPLLDMLRYHKLLAGHSWMAEYGDPDDASMAAAISKYSPYQNVKPGVKYPKVLFITSTKDDRVHPGHARKMVARMESQGHDVLYFENTQGGHGAAANLDERVQRNALEYTYLFERLFPK